MATIIIVLLSVLMFLAAVWLYKQIVRNGEW